MLRFFIGLISVISLTACPGSNGPLPTPTPAPSATSTPEPTATVSPTPLTCLPKPPPLDNIGLKVHNHPEPLKWVIDSTPKVVGLEYCTSVGFVNRRECPVRQEGDPLRVVCEMELLGGYGPEWSSPTGNVIFPQDSNPFLAVFKGESGTVRACTWLTPKKCFDLSVP